MGTYECETCGDCDWVDWLTEADGAEAEALALEQYKQQRDLLYAEGLKSGALRICDENEVVCGPTSPLNHYDAPRPDKKFPHEEY